MPSVKQILIFLLAATALWGQEGHPLTGSWHGQWTSGAQKGNVVLFLKWDTKNIVGTVNPGPNSMTIKNWTLDPATWTVKLEADGKDKAGTPTHVVIEGKLDNLGSYNRTLTGTWTQGAMKADLKATRD